MTKLTDKKIRLICQHVVDKCDWTKERIAQHFGISVRRVEQLIKEYRDTGEYPKLNKSRRPRSPPLTADERKLIDEIWEKERLGARLLYHELKHLGHSIPKHKIHTYLVKTGKTIPNPNKQKKRKRCRYERDHSFSLVHGDWHRTTDGHPHAILWLDDAARFILAGDEFENATSENSVITFKKAENKAKTFNGIIREVNTDRGPQFLGSRGGQTIFQKHLEKRGINFIPSRRNNPQTNGKLERLWLEYDRHRWRFNNINSFIRWYNRRIHGALWLEIGECPEDAVWRKNQPASTLGLFWRLNQ